MIWYSVRLFYGFSVVATLSYIQAMPSLLGKSPKIDSRDVGGVVPNAVVPNAAAVPVPSRSPPQQHEQLAQSTSRSAVHLRSDGEIEPMPIVSGLDVSDRDNSSPKEPAAADKSQKPYANRDTERSKQSAVSQEPNGATPQVQLVVSSAPAPVQQGQVLLAPTVLSSPAPSTAALLSSASSQQAAQQAQPQFLVAPAPQQTAGPALVVQTPPAFVPVQQQAPPLVSAPLVQPLSSSTPVFTSVQQPSIIMPPATVAPQPVVPPGALQPILVSGGVSGVPAVATTPNQPPAAALPGTTWPSMAVLTGSSGWSATSGGGGPVPGNPLPPGGPGPLAPLFAPDGRMLGYVMVGSTPGAPAVAPPAQARPVRGSASADHDPPLDARCFAAPTPAPGAEPCVKQPAGGTCGSSESDSAAPRAAPRSSDQADAGNGDSAAARGSRGCEKTATVVEKAEWFHDVDLDNSGPGGTRSSDTSGGLWAGGCRAGEAGREAGGSG